MHKLFAALLHGKSTTTTGCIIKTPTKTPELNTRGDFSDTPDGILLLNQRFN